MGEAQKHSIVGRETNNLTDEAWGELQKQLVRGSSRPQQSSAP
jgi:hypothetical protein